MKRKYFFNFGLGIIMLCLVGGVIISVNHFQKQEVDNQEVQQQEPQKQGEREQQASEQKVEPQETEEADDSVLLRTMVSVSEADIKMEGWFADLLKEKLNIEIYHVGYLGVYREKYVNKEEVDLYYFHGSLDYYDQIKEGNLKNLEPYIKKHPKIYSRYSNAIKYVKKDTYKHTGKKGVYGFPVWLKSFDDIGKRYVNYCISVPVSAKHPEEAMKLLTWSASDEGIMNIAYGPEGQMWKKKKGKYVLIKDWYKINDKNPGKKFIEAKYGKEDFYRAVCKLELVGNRELAKELIK